MRRAAARLAVFSAVFIAVETLVFFWLAYYGRSNVWNIDGITQHFATLYYFNTIVRQFFAHPGAGFTLWSWQLGLGADVMSSLAHYVLGDPFVLISLAMPLKRIELAYAIMWLVRMYFAGLFSFMYFRRMGAASGGALAGSLVYVFTTFALFSGLRHPFFINPLVYLPLMLWGVEKVLARERPYLLVLSVFLAGVTNFYFFYMLTLMVVLYAVARYFDLATRDERWRGLAPAALRVGGFYALGTAMSAVVLLPVLIGVLGSSRSGVAAAIPLLYSARDYGAMALGLLSVKTTARSTFEGYSAIALLLVPVLLFRRREPRIYRWMLVAFAAILLLPAFGFVFNGFTIAGNRMVFGASLFVGGAVAAMLSEPTPFARSDLVLALGATLLYWLAAVVAQPGPDALVPLAFASVMLLVMAFDARRRKTPSTAFPVGEWHLPRARWALVGLVVLSLVANGVIRYNYRFSGLLKEWEPAGDVVARYARDPGTFVRTIPDRSWYRVDKWAHLHSTANEVVSSNDATVQNYYGVDTYLSVMDGDVGRFMQEIENRTFKTLFAYSGFDDRAVLNALLGVKYVIGSRTSDAFVPYGYSRAGAVDGRPLWRNDNALPIGFVYEKVVPREAYLRMTPLQRQNALLYGVVLDGRDNPGLETTVPADPSVAVPYSIPARRNDKGLVLAKREGDWSAYQEIKLRFDPVTGNELYLQLDGIGWSARPKAPKPVASTPGGLVKAARRRLLGTLPADRVYVTYKATDSPKKTERWDPPISTYRGKDDVQLINLGYRRRPATSVTVKMAGSGVLRYERIRILRVPLTDLAQQAPVLRRAGLRHARIGVNTLSGTVSTAKPGVLFLSVPYSTGWTATVDGNPAKVLRADTAFCGIPLSAGSHRVVMRYVTPGLRMGTAISALAVLVFAGVVVVAEKRERPA